MFLICVLVTILRGDVMGQKKRIQVGNDEVVLLGKNDVIVNPYYVRFKNLTMSDGFLGNGNYKFLVRDSLGYLWFWHDQEGLFRYNGILSTKFGISEGFLGREVNTAAVDKIGNIWFATSNGLWEFDFKTGKFSTYKTPCFSQKNIFSVNALSNGTLWLSTIPNSATFVFDPIKKQVLDSLDIVISYQNGHLDSSNILYICGSIHLDSDSIAWFRAIPRGPQIMYSINLREKKANGYSMSKIYWKDGIRSESSEFGILDLVFADADNLHFWVGNTKGGLMKYNKKTKKWTQYTAQNHQVNNFNTEEITSIVQKNINELWINGNVIFNKKTERYTVFPPNSNQPFSFPKERDNLSLEPDGYQGYWAIGKNIIHYDIYAQRFQLRPLSFIGESFGIGCYDKNQKHLLIPVNSSPQNPNPSILQYDCVKKKTEQNYYSELLKYGLVNHDIIKIIPSKRENSIFWVLTANGLFKLNATKKSLTHNPLRIKELNGKLTELIFLTDISEDKNGELWITRTDYNISFDGVFLMRYNPNTKTLNPFFIKQPQNPNWYPYSYANKIFCDSKGYVWIAPQSTFPGVAVLNPQTKAFKMYQCVPDDSTTLSHNIVTSFQEDAKGRVWLKTNGGFCFKTSESPKFERVSGFNRSENNFAFDKKGYLWVGSAKGLFSYDTLNHQWRMYDERHGIVNYANNIIMNEDSSRIFIGSDVEFDPAVFEQKAPPPNIVVESFNVFDKPLSLPTLPQFAEHITLNYDQNFFSIGFVGIGFQNPEETQYAYQLVGVEKDWVLCGIRKTAFYTNIEAGSYEFRVKAMNGDGVWSTVKTMNISIRPPFWQTWWFRFLAVFMLLSSLWFFYKNRIRQVRLEGTVKQKQAELLQKESEFRRSLAETEMSALRAQMNPHFIFNCLNSINNYMLDNDGKKASLYLTKFSRLIRLVLENSRTEKVTLANEMSALELYIEMEALRFKQKLRYEIKVDKSVQMDFIEIPPLLLQPYVENAIWHGLMHRKEGGNVMVAVTQPNENTLHIEITDDGIGRQAAMELKSRSAMRQKSFGMQITSERLQAINDIFGMQTHITIQDMQNTEGVALGTKVVIEIPC
jgi:ligand-binding sensor domain-containing protein